MEKRITVYKSSRNTIFDNAIRTRTIGEGEELPKDCYLTEAEAVQAYDAIQAAKKIEYASHLPEANRILDTLERDIKTLLNRSGCELHFTFEGDSHGIYGESLVISTTVNGREYSREVEF